MPRPPKIPVSGASPTPRRSRTPLQMHAQKKRRRDTKELEKPDDDYRTPANEPVSLDPEQPVVFAGFDDRTLNAPLRLARDGLPASAKYTFAKLAMTSNRMPRTAQQAEDWFNTHIRSGLDAKGFRVGWVRREQALIATRENPGGELIAFWRGPRELALTWENEATQARELEVTELADDPVKNDPLLRVQAEIARQLAREEQERQQKLQRELGQKLRATRLPNKG